MNKSIKVYEELTVIETYDWEISMTPVSIETISKLLKEEQFIHVWNELINKNNIKKIFRKELSDVEKIVYSIEDKTIRAKIESDIDKRIKNWLRVNVWVIQNLIQKY